MADGCDDGAFIGCPSRAPGVATKYYGYGYQVWLLPGADRRFVLLGIRGQMIFVDPATKLVMVHTAVRAKPVDRAASDSLLDILMIEVCWNGFAETLKRS